MDKENPIPASNVVSITTARGAHSAEGKDSYHLEDASRLRKLCETYMEKHGLSQSAFMLELNMTRAMYFQLCGSDRSPPKRPLGYDQVAAFARKLGVNIEDISPTMARRILEMSALVKLRTRADSVILQFNGK